MRAQFAMSVRRLEISLEEMRAKAADRRGEIAKQPPKSAVSQVELDKKTALIFALRAAGRGAKNAVRRIVEDFLYLYMRSKRRRREPKRRR